MRKLDSLSHRKLLSRLFSRAWLYIKHYHDFGVTPCNTAPPLSDLVCAKMSCRSGVAIKSLGFKSVTVERLGALTQSSCYFSCLVWCLSPPRCTNGYRRNSTRVAMLSTGIPSTLKQFLCASCEKPRLANLTYLNRCNAFY